MLVFGSTLFKTLPLFVLSAILESATHLLLKRGADRHANESGIAYYFRLLIDRDILAGIAFFAIESFLWVLILMFLPLSIAFPLTSIQKLFMMSFTIAVLREPVERSEVYALALIAIGLIIIAASGAH